MREAIPNLTRPRVNASDGLLMPDPESLYTHESLRAQHALDVFNAYFEGWAHGEALALAIGASCGFHLKNSKTNKERAALLAFGVVAHDRVLSPDKRALSPRNKVKYLQRQTENLSRFFAEN